MATILKEMLFESWDDENEIGEFEKVSLWADDGKMITPSIKMTLYPKLIPGIYRAAFSREVGYYCEKLTIESDELYKFKDDKINDLIEEINLFWSKSELYKQNKLIHKRGILLEGVPGCGKSSLITLLGKELIKQGGVVFIVPAEGHFLNYIEFLKTAFKEIQKETPIITVIEDIDQYVQTIPQLLDFLDGKSQIDHHVLIATSNNSEEIEDTILRPSRIDLRIEVDNPCENTRREFFTRKNVPNESIDEMVEKSEGMSFAEMKELFISVFMLDYNIDDATEKILNPMEKKNYLPRGLKNKKLGL